MLMKAFIFCAKLLSRRDIPKTLLYKGIDLYRTTELIDENVLYLHGPI